MRKIIKTKQSQVVIVNSMVGTIEFTITFDPIKKNPPQ